MKEITVIKLTQLLITAWLLACASAAIAQPVNDAFSAAQALTGNPVQSSGNNISASSETGEPSHAGVGDGLSVWWKWTATSNQRTTVDTVGSSFDTVLAVYTGSSVSTLTEIASNDDTNGLQSQVRFSPVAGTTYHIAVDAFSGSPPGDIVLNLLSADPAPVLASNPASGSTIALPGGALGSTSQTQIDLIATGGSATGTLTISCSSSQSVLIGALGSVPNGSQFNQTVNTGSQPTDLAIAAQVTATEQNLQSAVICTATPSSGGSYSFSYQIQVPAALLPNASPQISSIPPNGARLPLQAANVGGLARGILNLRVTPGLGDGSAVIACAGNNLQLGAAGSVSSAPQFTQTVGANGPALAVQVAAVAAATALDLSLSCNVSPSSGSPYTLTYTVEVPAGLVPESSNWTPVGPGPAAAGQVEGIAGSPANAVTGAVHVVLPHPSNADILYVGTVNGGVWRSDNARAASPNWIALTDRQASLSIGALVFDPSDNSARTLVAGIGRTSSFGRAGGALSGLLRSTDGGTTWTALAAMVNKNVIGLAVNGDTIVAASNSAPSNACADYGLFRSTNTGISFTKLEGAQGFAPGLVTALINDPSAPQTMYAHLDAADACGAPPTANGLYRSTDGGATWQKIGSPGMNTLMASSGKVMRAQARAGRIGVAIADSQLRGVYLSNDSGATWAALGFPETFEDDVAVGIHPGGQARTHTSLAISPSNANLVYVGGDRQPGDFPNSLGARDFSGRLFRGDSSVAGGSWTSLTHSGTNNNSAPHADSRSMVVDAVGRLIQGDDGGVYARLEPTSSNGGWISLNGDLQATEQHSVAFDAIAGVALSGNQDNGTMRQNTQRQRLWTVLLGGDGGDVAVDALQLAEANAAVSYNSAQFLNAFSRRQYSAANDALSLSFPELIGTDGSAGPAGQFVTPISTNQVVGHRLVIGGTNGVYESLDSGDTVYLIAEGVRARSPMSAIAFAYGAAGNPNILYVAGCRGASCLTEADDGVFVRTALGGPLSLVRVNTDGLVAQAVVVDRGNPAQAFVFATATDARQSILQTTDTGASWTDITGDLPSSAGVIRSLRHIEAPIGKALVIGTNNGVYIAAESQNYRSWTRLGEGLPNAPVSEIDFDVTRNLLIAGTLGRGTHTLALAPPAGSPGLQNGVAATGLAGAQGSSLAFTISIPEGARNLVVRTIGGTGNADLYVRFGSPATTTTFDCSSNSPTTAEECTIAAPSAGTYHVLILGLTSYSDLTLTASWQVAEQNQALAVSKIGTGSGTVTSTPAGIDCGTSCSSSFASGTLVALTAAASGGSTFVGWSGCDSSSGNLCSVTMNAARDVSATFNTSGGGSTVLQNGVPVNNLSGLEESSSAFTVDVPAGAQNLTIRTSGGTGDPDLYVRFGSPPTFTSADCRSTGSATSEQCFFAAPSAGTWHILVSGFRAYSGVTLTASWQLSGGGNSAEPLAVVNLPLTTGTPCSAFYSVKTFGNPGIVPGVTATEITLEGNDRRLNGGLIMKGNILRTGAFAGVTVVATPGRDVFLTPVVYWLPPDLVSATLEVVTGNTTLLSTRILARPGAQVIPPIALGQAGGYVSVRLNLDSGSTFGDRPFAIDLGVKFADNTSADFDSGTVVGGVIDGNNPTEVSFCMTQAQNVKIRTLGFPTFGDGVTGQYFTIRNPQDVVVFDSRNP